MPKQKMLDVGKNAGTHAKLTEAAKWSSNLIHYFREDQVDPVSLKVLVEAAVVLQINVQIVIKKLIVKNLEVALKVALVALALEVLEVM